MANYKTVYQCRECGATSYQQVIDRAQDGTLKATGQYKCTGCRNVFASIRAWWEPRRKHDFQASKFPNSAMANAAGAGSSLPA